MASYAKLHELWFWIFCIPSVGIACLNWCIIILAFRKDNIDHLALFSLDFFKRVRRVGLLSVALWFIGLIAYFLIPKVIGIVYTYLTWVLSTFKITIPDPDPNMVNLDQYGQPWGVAAVIKIGT